MWVQLYGMAARRARDTGEIFSFSSFENHDRDDRVATDDDQLFRFTRRLGNLLFTSLQSGWNREFYDWKSFQLGNLRLGTFKKSTKTA